MVNKQPMVSVLMTAYNREQYIAEAIESVLASSYQNWELIIVDDGSKDDTVAIARGYEEKDNRIKVYINEKNLGDYPNRNKAAGLAKGVYVQYLDSDDKLFDYSLQKMVDLAEAHPSVGIFMRSLKDEVFFIKSEEALYRHFFGQQFLYYGPGGVFLRKSFFDKIAHFPEKYGPANDMYFNLKAVCQSDIVTHPIRTVYYRIHDGQESKKDFEYIIQNFRYMNDALVELPLPFSNKKIKWLKKKNYRRFMVNLLKYYKGTGNYKNTIAAWKMADFKFKYFFRGVFH